jgi:hypothetical protein
MRREALKKRCSTEMRDQSKQSREGPERGARSFMRALASKWQLSANHGNAQTPIGPASKQLDDAVTSVSTLGDAVRAFENMKGISLRQTTRAQIEGERGWFWVIAPMLRADCDGADFQGLEAIIEVGDNARCRTIPARFMVCSVGGLPIATTSQRIVARATTLCEGNKPSAHITLFDGTREVKIDTDSAQFGLRSIPVINADAGLFESAAI